MPATIGHRADYADATVAVCGAELPPQVDGAPAPTCSAAMLPPVTTSKTTAATANTRGNIETIPFLMTFAARPASPDDAPILTQIYNEGIEDRVGTFETRPRAVQDVAVSHAPFDGFNLSDIFEYLDPPTCAAPTPRTS